MFMLNTQLIKIGFIKTGKTQIGFAREFGYNQSTVNQYIHNERTAKPKFLKELSIYISIPIEQMILLDAA